MTTDYVLQNPENRTPLTADNKDIRETFKYY